ncbi:MAG: hypothetical protein ACLQD9_00065 [Thermoplasmata archaeon]
MRMGEAGIVLTGRRYRRARRLDRGKRGVVAVVGTLLALLVFFALFGIFLTQYVPLWMTDNERQFADGIESSFALLKSAVDEQYSLGGPATYATPFTLASQAVPLLSQPTQATLTFIPANCPAGFFPANGTPEQPNNCIFQHVLMGVGTAIHPATNHPFNETSSVSVLQGTLPDRYYPSVNYYFEDDAVFLTQTGGHQLMIVPPPLNVTKVGPNTTVQSSYLQLFGNASVYTSQGTKDVFTHYDYSQPYSSSGRFATTTGTPVPFNFTFEVGTHNVCGWYTFLQSLVTTSGLVSSAYSLTGSVAFPPSTSVCQDSGGASYDISLEFLNINYATTAYAGVEISFTQGGA